MTAYQVIDARTARQIHEEAVDTPAMAAWVIMANQREYPKFVARLMTTQPTPYVLVTDSLV